MRNRVRTIQVACVLGLGMLSGCTSMLPYPEAPFFPADSADIKLIEALAHEQDIRIKRCHEDKSCPQDQYTRGLIALFQSREQAVAAFQQVGAVAPNSRLAALSTSWIDLLQANGRGFNFLTVQSSGVPKVTEDYVWEAIERELDEANESVGRLFSARAKRVWKLTERSSLSSQDQARAQFFRRRLHERERILAERDQQIDVMTSQFDALKRIELDVQSRRRTLRPAVTVAP